MALPSKRKGWRKISVDGKDYRWKFVLGKTSGTLLFRVTESGEESVAIDFPDHADPWINFGHSAVAAPPITPSVVAEAIRIYLKTGPIS